MKPSKFRCMCVRVGRFLSFCKRIAGNRRVCDNLCAICSAPTWSPRILEMKMSIWLWVRVQPRFCDFLAILGCSAKAREDPRTPANVKFEPNEAQEGRPRRPAKTRESPRRAKMYENVFLRFQVRATRIASILPRFVVFKCSRHTHSCIMQCFKHMWPSMCMCHVVWLEYQLIQSTWPQKH